MDELSGSIGAARRHTLSSSFRRAALRHGQRTALICGAVSWTYADLHALVERLAAGLAARGVAPGDRIAMLARNSHAFVAMRYAVARAGAVLVPINFMLLAREVRYILDHSGARMLCVDATTLAVGLEAAAEDIALVGLAGEADPPPTHPRVRDWAALVDPAAPPPPESGAAHDLLQIMYTSGTEALPKGVMLTHEAVLWQYQACIIDCEWTRDTVALHALPFYHCAQLDAMLGPGLQVGALNIVTATPTADTLIPLLARHRVTSFFAPPTIWIALLRSPLFDTHDLSALAKGYYGASIMPVEVLREIQRRMPRLRLWNLYGQTEIAPVALALFPDEHATRCGSAGRATVNVETRVVDDALADVAVGEVGELVHRSPQLMTGYWQDPERTRAAFTGGWFHTGDLGTIDAEGYITVVDRKKDMIKTGGENVSSREVEEVIYAHPGVSEVAVIGLPDPRWIEAVTAVVVARDGEHIDERGIIDHCARTLAGYKLPKRVLFVETLPRNASGKILKRDLRLVG